MKPLNGLKHVQLNLDYKTMFEIKTIADLQRLIQDEIEESTVLEYKSSFAIQNKKWKEELAKDVSALANSNGGNIIFGIREKECDGGNSIPEKLLPVPNTEMSKDKLSQLLSSNIQPKIDGLEITYIPFDEKSGFYVVFVPRSNTAHQNRLSHVYYKRRNATVEAMEDYEIRDIMNRSKTPVIDVEFTLLITKVNVTKNKTPFGLFTAQKIEEKSIRYECTLKFRAVNNGQILAKYVNYYIYVPQQIIENIEESDLQDGYYVRYEDNTIRDIVGIELNRPKYGPARYDPILPGMCDRRHSVKLSIDDIKTITDLPCIKYEMHADNAPTRIKEIKWEDIIVEEQSKEEYFDNIPHFAPNI